MFVTMMPSAPPVPTCSSCFVSTWSPNTTGDHWSNPRSSSSIGFLFFVRIWSRSCTTSRWWRPVSMWDNMHHCIHFSSAIVNQWLTWMEELMTAHSIETLHPTKTDHANWTPVLCSTTMPGVLCGIRLIMLHATAPDATCWFLFCLAYDMW